MYIAVTIVLLFTIINNFCFLLENKQIGEKGNLETFDLYWNVPTFQCHKYGLNFSEISDVWEIKQNYNDQFRGEQIAILYDPGDFPAILSGAQSSPVITRNSGVPQEGNLYEHLNVLSEQIEKLIPNEKFSGLAILDFEHWRPIWRQNWVSLNIYRKYSRAIEHLRHPKWNSNRIEAEATRRWEISAKQFLLESLKLAKLLRPYAKWGYYGYPFCFNYTPHNDKPHCSNQVLKDNDKIQWLFRESTGGYPSLYLKQNGLTKETRIKFMIGRIRESMRVFKSVPIYPYIWYKYHDTRQFLSKEDLANSFLAIKQKKLNGAVIWGASNDVNTKLKCQQLRKFINDILGPVYQKIKWERQLIIYNYPANDSWTVIDIDEIPTFYYVE